MEIAKLSAGNAEQYYYEKDAIFNSEGDGANLEAHGDMAAAFGLQEGETIDKDKFKAIMAGETEEGNSYVSSNRKTAAFDLPLSAPKGVSVLALNGDDDLMKAHDKAVSAVVQKLNDEYSKVQGKDEFGKSVSKEGSGLMIATAKHATARAGSKGIEDPHLHTHLVIANSTYDKESGKMKALDAKDLFKDQKKLEVTYKSELAKEVQKLGYKLEERKGGNFDIAIDDKVRDQFSSRRNDIKDEAKGMAEGGKQGSDRDLERYAQHNNKNSKTENTADDLRESWNEQLQQHNYNSFNELAESAKMTQEEKLERNYFKDESEALKFAAKALNENEAKFGKDELLKVASTVSYGQFSYNDLEKDLSTVKKTGQKEDGDLKKLDGDNYTTKGMNDIEKDNLKMMKSGKQFEAIMTDKQADKAINKFEAQEDAKLKKINPDADYKLTDGQKAMVKEILTSTDQFIAINGAAGSGKTTSLEIINIASKIENNAKDLNLKVLAPSGKAALGAQRDSGIEGATVAKFLIDKGVNGKEGLSGQKVASAHIKGFKKNEDYVFSGNAFAKGKGKEWTVDPANKSGMRTAKDGAKIATYKTEKKGKGSYSSEKRERILDGKNKGSIRDISFKAKGNKTETDIKTTLSNGDKIRTNIKVTSNSKISETVKLSKDGQREKEREVKIDGTFGKSTHKVVDKKGKRTENTDNSMFLGMFKAKTTSTTIKDKDGNITAKATTREKTIMGYTFGKTEYADVKTGKAEQVSFQRDSKGNVSDVNVLQSKEGVTGISQKQSDRADKKLDTDHIRMVKTKGFLIVDESSMLGAKDANAILKIAKDEDLRVAFIGDNKQLKSVSSGEFFKQLQEVKMFEGDKTVIMDESLRQKNDLQKSIAGAAANKDIGKSIDIMSKNELITENKDKDVLVDKMATKIANDPSILGLASTGKDTKALNEAIREKNGHSDKEGLNTIITAKKNMTAVKQASANSYEKDDLVSSFKGVGGMKKGLEYKVSEVDKIKNTVKMEGEFFNKKSGKTEIHNVEVNAKKLSGNITTGKEEKRDFVIDDKVIFTKNNKEMGVMNGQVGTIEAVNTKTNSMKVNVGSKSVNVDLNEYKNVDHGYAISVHASQGVTESKVAVLMDSKNGGMNNANAGYVALSRQKDKVEVFTDDVNKLKSQIIKEQDKTTTLTDEDWSKKANSDEGLDKFTSSKSEVKSSENDVKSSEKQEEKAVDNKTKNAGSSSEAKQEYKQEKEIERSQ